MKRFSLFTATSSLGCYLTFLCADLVLAGSVPVGSLSGVNLPGRSTAPASTPSATAPSQTVPNAGISNPNITPPSSSQGTAPASVTTAIPQVTPLEVGQTTAAQVAIGQGVTVTAADITLSIPARRANLHDNVSTTVTLASVSGNVSEFLLEGTSGQVTNASAFLAVATAADFNPSQVQVGTSIALTGADYAQVAALMNTLRGLVVTLSSQNDLHQPAVVLETPGTQVNFFHELSMINEAKKFQGVPISSVDHTTLNTTIFIYNQILDSSDDVTVVALSKNKDFLAIGATLRQLRAAIDIL